MSQDNFKKIISAVAIGFVLLHLLWPELGVDFVTIALIAIALLPWILPLLKSFELPGGLKIELKDTKSATDKITKVVHVSGNIQATSSITGTATVKRKEPDPILLFREIAATDPKLAFVAFRIEIEKRLRSLAEQYNISNLNQPLSKLIKDLQADQRIPTQVASGLSDLITLGNQAAHGLDVDPVAVNWLLDDSGPSILATIDDLLKKDAKS